MDDEQREAIRASNRKRAYTCPKCGAASLHERDGQECGGLAGISYRICGACGWVQAKTKRQPKFKLS